MVEMSWVSELFGNVGGGTTLGDGVRLGGRGGEIL